MNRQILSPAASLRLWILCLLPLLLGFFWGSPQGIHWNLFFGLLLVILVLSCFFWQFQRLYKHMPMRLSQSHSQLGRIAWALLFVQINLFVAGIWDEVWHIKYGIPFGEDFFWRPHLLLYAGFGLVLYFGLEAWLKIFWQMKGRLSQRLEHEPILGIFVFLLTYLLLVLPLDPFWHLLYGEDISVWSIPHALMFYLGLGLNMLCFAAVQASLHPRERVLPKFLLLLIFSFMAYFQLLDFRPFQVNPSLPAWLLPNLSLVLAFGLWTLARLFFGGGYWAFCAASLALLLRLALMQIFHASAPDALWQGLAVLLPLGGLSIGEIIFKQQMTKASWRCLLSLILACVFLAFYLPVFQLTWTPFDSLLLLGIFPSAALLETALSDLLNFLTALALYDEEAFHVGSDSPSLLRSPWLLFGLGNLLFLIFWISTATPPV